ncbi:hypothetical protein FQA47_015987 [Oryzias melastigma]|uniref:Uncharacterized protein n=1 Tax=Oryzias melastigma TaxID=30732 RepID=A0A834F3B2_ORYME|nr:hypothetical protein FQA47_015987 [Oryzias melastigma]
MFCSSVFYIYSMDELMVDGLSAAHCFCAARGFISHRSPHAEGIPAFAGEGMDETGMNREMQEMRTDAQPELGEAAPPRADGRSGP